MKAPNQNDNEITIERLEEVFKTARIVRGIAGSHKAPSPDAMKTLAEYLDALRLVGQMAPTFKAQNQALIDLLAGLHLVRDAIPRLPEPVIEAHPELSDLWRVAADFQDGWVVDQWCESRERKLPDFERWKFLAPMLVRAFRKAMASTNPGIEFKLSNKGPVARFCEAVIPMITGEEPDGVAVARCLQRANK